jgi:hypothetical protein
MIDKKQLINELLECVQDATDLETKITGLTMCATLFESVLEEAINYTHCCESDSELFFCCKQAIDQRCSEQCLGCYTYKRD